MLDKISLKMADIGLISLMALGITLIWCVIVVALGISIEHIIDFSKC